MSNKWISTLLWVAVAAVTSVGDLSAQVRVVDLTDTRPNVGQWKVVVSGTGGPVGTSPTPPAYLPVKLHLTNCVVKNAELYFSVEIENDRKVEVQVPISMNSKQFGRGDTIKFRELQLRLGTTTNLQDATTFEVDPRFPEIMLFGDQSIPGTMAVLAPGEHLLFRFKSQIQSKDRNLSNLRARITGFDETLSPLDDGFRKLGGYVPALFAISESICPS